MPLLAAQANLQRKELAQELMLEARKRNLDFALLQEPYVGGIGQVKDYRGARIYQCTNRGVLPVKAAIVVFNDDMVVVPCPDFTTNNIAVVKVTTKTWEIVLLSMYFEPDQDIEPYLEQLRCIVQNAGSSKVLIGGDANAKTTCWGSPKVDHRGESLAGVLEELGMHVLNKGNTPTFHTVRGGKVLSSFVDVTVCTEEMLVLVGDWRVDEGLVNSDHNAITFRVNLERPKGVNIQRTTRVYNTRKADWIELRERLAQLATAKKLTSEAVDQARTPTELDA